MSASAAAPEPQVRPIDAAPILQVAMGFWPSKVLLTAAEMELFTVLGDGSRTSRELGEALAIDPRGRLDFFDALVALGFLERDGNGDEARYRNTALTSAFLVRGRPYYVGGLLAMMGSRLFGIWGRLDEALRSGKAQNEARDGHRAVFDEIYSDPARLREFLRAMDALQMANFDALAEAFDFSPHRAVTDAGGALAQLSRTIAPRHPHLRFRSFDLPQVAPLAEEAVRADGLAGRIEIVSGDFFRDPLPRADVVAMGNVLHDWNLEKKRLLLRKAWDALDDGGVLLVIENIIDDERRQNSFGLMMSLNMLLEFGDAFDYTAADLRSWCAEAGFAQVEVLPLAGPTSLAVAYK